MLDKNNEILKFQFIGTHKAQEWDWKHFISQIHSLGMSQLRSVLARCMHNQSRVESDGGLTSGDEQCCEFWLIDWLINLTLLWKELPIISFCILLQLDNSMKPKFKIQITPPTFCFLVFDPVNEDRINFQPPPSQRFVHGCKQSTTD